MNFAFPGSVRTTMTAVTLSPLDRVQSLASRGLLALPPKAQVTLSGRGTVRIDGQELDPQMQLLLTLLRINGFVLRDPDAAVARERFSHDAATFSGRPGSLAWTRELEVAGGDGPLAARLYVPHGYRAPGALLVFLHGGAWVVGDVDTHDSTCRFLARHAGCAVVSVGYRLAPEHPYPAPVDDAIAAFADIVARADELGADPARIAVGGDSAGGHLSAIVAQQAVASGGPAPAFQLLLYPVTDTGGGDWRSRQLFAAGFLLEQADVDWGVSCLMGEAGDAADPRANPISAEDLHGVAPAYVVTAGFDPLRDEGEAYAARLRAAGVAVTLRRQSGLLHGFATLLGISSSAARATAEAAGALQVGLAPRGT